MKDTIKNNIRQLSGLIVSLLLGFLIGWLVFSANSTTTDKNTIDNPIKTPPKEEIWTCSMHPQIRQNEPGDCPICGMDLIPISEDANQDNATQLVMTKEAVKLAQVETTVVGNLSAATSMAKPQKEIFLTGKVQMDARTDATQVAHMSGRLEELLVAFEGEQVRKNQKIAVLYAPELVSAQKELLEAIKLKKEYPALYEAARQKILQWKLPLSTIKEIEESGQIQREVAIYAERSGILTRRYVEEGDYVKQGSPLFDIMDLNRVWVLFDVHEKDLKWIKKGTTIEFNIEAMPQKTYRSKITFIDPIINPNTRVAAARVELNNRSGMLKPEMFAKGIVRVNPLPSKDVSSPIVVPKTAVLWTGKRSVIYVKNPEVDVPTFEFREVELGADLGEHFIVKEGVSDGEEIVVNGAFRIDAAAQLSNKNSMMNRLVRVKETALREHQLPNYQKEVSDEFKRLWTELIKSYLVLKNALVASDFDKAQQASEVVAKKMEHIDMSLLEGKEHLFWMEKMPSIEKSLETLHLAKSIDAQRAAFATLSDELIPLVKVFGITEGTFFVQYCPMALDDKGANWLSQEEGIQNPYFGDKMLRCGSIEETLSFKK
ncbi:efflux RND transporter periplasmic adaptor subunit [Aureispira sp. CCB-E]|uniref:efflux RND transporter periplasmic adaptor subunit n=1 Tax=Aureispira sp. CCB-E TaxID=3051121 RepID=UPI002868909F|nr:efflux RND transporter periplasmic adaptor subunit [Aureispira sp. CCB-E]WMX13779.1 efflux RND transporter periplasmic adaptor subunit [Aureispira sp. CCB-E]